WATAPAARPAPPPARPPGPRPAAAPPSTCTAWPATSTPPHSTARPGSRAHPSAASSPETSPHSSAPSRPTSTANVAAYASPETRHGGPENPGGGLEHRAEPPTGPQPATDPQSATGHGLGKTRLPRPHADAGHRVGHRADALHAALDDHAAASRHRPRRDPGPRGAAQILNAAYLLDEEQVPSFLAVTRAAGERLDGIDIEVTGPRPPYSFVDPADPTPAPDPRDTAR